MKYCVISSTNREGSTSLKLSGYIAEMLSGETDVEVEIVDLSLLPADVVFSSLYQNNGKNDVFNAVRDQVQSADKLVFVIPEYNGSFPGVLKVFIDGLSYPFGIRGKKAALVGISGGTIGSTLAMAHFTDILNYLGCHVLAQKIRISSVNQVFNGEQIVSEKLQAEIQKMLTNFVSF